MAGASGTGGKPGGGGKMVTGPVEGTGYGGKTANPVPADTRPPIPDPTPQVGGHPIVASFDTTNPDGSPGRSYMNDRGEYGNPTVSRGPIDFHPQGSAPHLPGSLPSRLAEGEAMFRQHAPEMYAGGQALGQRVRVGAERILGEVTAAAPAIGAAIQHAITPHPTGDRGGNPDGTPSTNPASWPPGTHPGAHTRPGGRHGRNNR